MRSAVKDKVGRYTSDFSDNWYEPDNISCDSLKLLINQIRILIIIMIWVKLLRCEHHFQETLSLTGKLELFSNRYNWEPGCFRIPSDSFVSFRHASSDGLWRWAESCCMTTKDDRTKLHTGYPGYTRLYLAIPGYNLLKSNWLVRLKIAVYAI